VSFLGSRRETKYCKDCWKLVLRKCGAGASKNPYVYDSELWKKTGHTVQHRAVAEQLLHRKLKSHEIVHHVDECADNNSPSNLIVLSRNRHVSLHRYLNIQRVIYEKSLNENTENCWNSLIAPMTTAWLETAGVKVIKLWEIGQPAAEPASDKPQEGSETMHGAPDHLVEGEDIVQTTT
jgi:hypothetical protein